MASEFQRILKHSFISVLGSIISRMITFVLLPVYTNVLSKEEYGLMELLQNTMIVIQVFVGSDAQSPKSDSEHTPHRTCPLHHPPPSLQSSPHTPTSPLIAGVPHSGHRPEMLPVRL